MDRSTDDSSGDESEVIKACKICLETEGKLPRITCGEVRDAYRNLTGIQWDTSDRLPQHMCGECSARLRIAVGLRQKALSSLGLLDEIREMEPTLSAVTSRHIHLEDRTHRSLNSNLRIMHFTPNEYLGGVSTKCDKYTNTEYDDYLGVHKRLQGRAKTYRNRKLDDIENIEHDNSMDNDSTTGNSKLEHVAKRDTRSANDASDTDTGGLEIAAVDAAVTKIQDYDSDESEKVLVIDIEERMETVLSSEQVGNSDRGMPIDELIDIYNNDGDGDGRLQELNEHFTGESTIRIDQGWGIQRDACGRLHLRAVRDSPVPCLGPRSAVETSKREISKDFYMSKPYEKLNPDLFTFSQVSELEQIAEIAKRQYTIQFRQAALKCFVCFKNFNRQLTYDAHMQRHNPTRGEFECNICKVRHASARLLKRHVDNNHVVKIVCNGCGFVTMNRDVAQNHEKFHEGAVYQCVHCPSLFNTQSAYNSHLRRCHLQAFTCVLCGSTFLSKKGLAVHRYRIHPDADQVALQGPRCDPCDLVFASYEAYSRHMSLSSRHGPYSNKILYPSDVKPREPRK